MYSTTQRRYTYYQFIEVSKEIHVVYKNVSKIDILNTENEELREQLKTVKDENKQKETRVTLSMKEAEELRDSNKKKVTRFQTEINQLKESKSDNFVDVNSNSKQVINNNSEKAADSDNKYNEKVKEIGTSKTHLVKVEDALKESEKQ